MRAVRPVTARDLEKRATKTLKTHYSCPACNHVLLKPMTGSCGHTFCRYCYVKYNRKTISVGCPVCKQDISWVEEDAESASQIEHLYEDCTDEEKKQREKLARKRGVQLEKKEIEKNVHQESKSTGSFGGEKSARRHEQSDKAKEDTIKHSNLISSRGHSSIEDDEGVNSKYVHSSNGATKALKQDGVLSISTNKSEKDCGIDGFRSEAYELLPGARKMIEFLKKAALENLLQNETTVGSEAAYSCQKLKMMIKNVAEAEEYIRKVSFDGLYSTRICHKSTQTVSVSSNEVAFTTIGNVPSVINSKSVKPEPKSKEKSAYSFNTPHASPKRGSSYSATNNTFLPDMSFEAPRAERTLGKNYPIARSRGERFMRKESKHEKLTPSMQNDTFDSSAALAGRLTSYSIRPATAHPNVNSASHAPRTTAMSHDVFISARKLLEEQMIMK